MVPLLQGSQACLVPQSGSTPQGWVGLDHEYPCGLDPYLPPAQEALGITATVGHPALLKHGIDTAPKE